MNFPRRLRPTFVLFLVSLCLILSSVAQGNDFPVGDAFDRKQAEIEASPAFNPRNSGPGVVHRSLRPNLTEGFDEAHPFPDYIKKFDRKGNFPVYYMELLQQEPVDHVQSKIFDQEAFNRIHRIGVVGFENKTVEPFKDARAGDVVASQISQELDSVKKYRVIPPQKMVEDASFKIVTTPPEGTRPVPDPSTQPQAEAPDRLPYSSDKMDAVMIGAVTKYINHYRDRRGNLLKSYSSGVEFGAFLISTETGKVIWGARYVASQKTGTASLLQSPVQWMEKEELSRSAMKHVLKAFRDTQIPNP